MILPGTLEQSVCAEVEARILSGKFKPGERLRQDDLAAEFGVSHIPVREAFRRLAARGFVDLHSRRGARVAVITASDVAEHLAARVVVETALLEAAIPQFSERDAQAAKKALRNPPKDASWPQRNWEFHRCLYAPAGNGVLLEIAEQLHSTARAAILHGIVTQNVQASTREHERLLALVLARKTSAALTLLRAHIEIRSASLKARLKKLPAR